MKPRTKRSLFCTLVSFLCFFLLCLPNAGILSDRNSFKSAEATTGLNLILVGKITPGDTEWNNSSEKWLFTETGDGYVINNVYMEADDAYSNFRIVIKNTWDKDHGFSKIVTNEPGFTDYGVDDNIHITKTGYYNFKIYDSESKIDITYSDFTLVGNIQNNGDDWNPTPKNGNWKLTKNSIRDYQIKNVYMVSHSSANFRIIHYGDNKWLKNIGYTQLANGNNNKPGFTATGEDNNIHITETGYYDIYLWWHNDKNDWAIDIHYNDDKTSNLECQMFIDGAQVTSRTGFDYTFIYNNRTQNTTYSGLSNNKTLTNARGGRKYYLTGYSCPTGYYLDKYEIGYPGHMVPYTETGSSSERNATTHCEPDVNNYIKVYFKTAYYTITYNRNGGSDSNPTNQTPQVGAEVTLATYSGTKTGYTFTGWNTNSSGTGSHYNAGGTYTPEVAKDGTLALHAEWTAKTSNLTFNLNGGSGTPPTGKTAKYGQAMPAYGQSAPTRNGYRFEGYYDTSATTGGTQYYTSALASARNWDKDTTSGTTLYARWTQLYTLTYNYYDTNGTTVKSASSAAYASGSSVTLPTPTQSGYKFVKWYTAYNSTTHVFSGTEYAGGASYTTTSANVTLYAKFIAVGIYLNGQNYNWTLDSNSKLVSAGQENLYKITSSFAANDEMKIVVITESTETYYGSWYKQSAGDASGKFDNTGGSGSDNNLRCNTAGSYDIYFNSSSHYFYFYYPTYPSTGYYMSGTGTFASLNNRVTWSLDAAMRMTDTSSVEGSSNIAVLENPSAGIAVAAGSEFKVVNNASYDSVTWHDMALGGSYSFAELGTDDFGQHFIRIKTAGNYNFYYGKDNKMYIVDFSEIQKAGTLYYTSSKSDISAINVTTVNTKSESPFNNVGLDNVEGARKMSTTLKYGSGYVYLIPIFNLRGSDTGSAVTTVTLDGVTITVTGLGGNSQNYYIEGSTTDEAKYIGLKVALDIDEAIQDTAGKSVCEVDADTAADLCERYDAVTAAQGSSSLATSTIHTWAKAKGDSGADIPMSSIRVELGNRSGDPKYSSAIHSFDPFSMINGEGGGDYATTIIIIIASSIALVSISVLSVILVKKQKKTK